MSTTLEIDCNGCIKTQSITHSICRIGSNPGLELCMPGLDDHMVTLRIQNGKKQLYNRSSKPIKLNGRHLQPEQTLEWSGNQILELTEGVRVRLLNAKDESRVVHASAAGLASDPAKAAAANTTTARQKQRRMTIVGFFLVFATILYSSDSSETDQAIDQEFTGVVETLLEAERKPDSGCYRQIRVELQNAILRPELRNQSIRNVQQILGDKARELDSTIGRKVVDFLSRIS